MFLVAKSGGVYVYLSLFLSVSLSLTHTHLLVLCGAEQRLVRDGGSEEEAPCSKSMCVREKARERVCVCV